MEDDYESDADFFSPMQSPLQQSDPPEDMNFNDHWPQSDDGSSPMDEDDYYVQGRIYHREHSSERDLELAGQAHPYTLGTKPVTLNEFVDQAAELHGSHKYEDFTRWVLNGKTPNGRQLTLESFRNRVTDAQELSASKDYDSVLGIDNLICIENCELTIPLVARFEDTLKTNIHLRYHFRNIHVRYFSFSPPWPPFNNCLIGSPSCPCPYNSQHRSRHLGRA